MNKHILFASLVISASLITTSAQSTSTPLSQPTTGGATSTSQAVILAEISLYNAKLQKAGLVNYNFSFTLSSSDLIDQEAYYRVILNDKDNKVVFLQSFPKKVTIPAGKSVFVIDTLIVPEDFKGTYSTFVQVTNDKGLPLATANTGKIELTGGKSVMSIKSCDVTGSSTKTTSEAIDGSCVVLGKTSKNTTLYTTVYSGGMAAPVAQIKSRLVANKATFSILPRTEPGSYQVVSQLYDAGTPMSGPVFNTFIVTGQSANIVTIKTDKGVYAKDEIAQVAVYLRTVNIKSGDISIKASLKTKNGEVCGEVAAAPVKNGDTLTLLVPIIQKCSLPTVTVTLTDNAGKVLDTLSTEVVSTGVKEKPMFAGLNTTYAGIVGLLIALAVLGFYIVRRKQLNQVTV